MRVAGTSEVAGEERLPFSAQSLVTGASRCRASVLSICLGPGCKIGGLGHRKMACLIAMFLEGRDASRDCASRTLLLRSSGPHCLQGFLFATPLGCPGWKEAAPVGWIVSFWEWILSPALT